MNYENVKDKLSIGSGVTEAGCKVIIKQRLCQAGMRWKEKAARVSDIASAQSHRRPLGSVLVKNLPIRRSYLLNRNTPFYCSKTNPDT
ncbi:MAG: hypothetical protein R3F19_31990 [Verrucomicrobiales bacterium]